MQSQQGTSSIPLRVAIIGAGPSGLYAADALLKQLGYDVHIDIFDKLPTPYGLVRYGVAPDHQKIKSVTRVFDKTLSDPRVRFFGNVHVGQDLTRDELDQHYDQIVYAIGAQTDRQLNIPGEDLAGSLSATEFVAWYNGHPDYRNLSPDLSGERAVVIGAGNVALDVARILMQPHKELARTDIADYALDQLASSSIKHVDIFVRRGPAQAKFTPTELKELGNLEEVNCVVNPRELELDPVSARDAETDKRIQRNLAQLQSFAEEPAKQNQKHVTFRFLTSPTAFNGANGHVREMVFETNQLVEAENGTLKSVGIGKPQTIPADLVLRSIGYRGLPLPNVPFDEKSGTIPNTKGHVRSAQLGILPKEYVVGWAKRGPSGVIGTNKQDAAETVEQMVADFPMLEAEANRDAQPIETLLSERGVRFISYAEWQQIDEHEWAMGQQQGRERVKMTSVEQILEFLGKYTWPEKSCTESCPSYTG